MEILVDNEIVGGEAAFSAFGRVRLFDGRGLERDALGEAGALITRSVTRVDGALVAGSRLRFVGTTTAGTDHVDAAALARAGIAFAAAPGCNALAVAEHVVCCLYAYAAERGLAPQTLRVGIVGYGHVGRALAALLTAIDVAWVVNDPPLRGATGGAAEVTLDELLGCDVVTLHTPLTSGGEWPTQGLVDETRVSALRPHALLINAARGGIVDEHALLERLRNGPPLYTALDCWAGEPRIDTALARMVWQGSPHIAGHTLEARINATRQVRDALRDHLGVGGDEDRIPRPPGCQGATRGVAELLGLVHDLAGHTGRIRALAAAAAAARVSQFDADRRNHGLRRAFSAYRVNHVPRDGIARPGGDADTVARLRALGFDVSPGACEGAL